MRREDVARCSEGHPRLREAELSVHWTVASSRRPLSSPWIRRPSVVDGSGIVRSSIAAAARFWLAPPWHHQRYDAGRLELDDALLQRVLGLPTLARCFVGAAQAALLLRRAWPTSRGVAQAVCPDPPAGTRTTSSSRGISTRDAGTGALSSSDMPRWLSSL
jgi:hypothetical protein